MSEVRTVTVACDGGDVVGGADHVALQQAVDRVADRGGGVVAIGPGIYDMGDSLHLRSHVSVRGAGEKTILRKRPMVSSALAADLGYGHFDITLAEPDLFAPGTGVHIADDNAPGFYSTVATLTRRNGNTFGISRMLNHDYSRARNGVVRSVFPVISGYDLHDVEVSDLVIDGNKQQNEYLNGCRGGGIFLCGASAVTIRNVTVHDYHGDGISFQQTRDVCIEDCVCADNGGHGLHPGSGSVRSIMRRVRCTGNAHDGIFYCLRVSYSLTEECRIEGNGWHGISIGGRDTDHLIRNNCIRHNGRHGLYFREADAVMAGHRCHIEDNTLESNCAGEGAGEIRIDGAVMAVHLLHNRIIPAEREGRPAIGVVVGRDATGIVIDGNQFAPESITRVEQYGPSGAVMFGPPPEPLSVGPDAAPPDAARHLQNTPEE